MTESSRAADLLAKAVESARTRGRLDAFAWHEAREEFTEAEQRAAWPLWCAVMDEAAVTDAVSAIRDGRDRHTAIRDARRARNHNLGDTHDFARQLDEALAGQEQLSAPTVGVIAQEVDAAPAGSFLDGDHGRPTAHTYTLEQLEEATSPYPLSPRERAAVESLGPRWTAAQLTAALPDVNPGAIKKAIARMDSQTKAQHWGARVFRHATPPSGRLVQELSEANKRVVRELSGAAREIESRKTLASPNAGAYTTEVPPQEITYPQALIEETLAITYSHDPVWACRMARCLIGNLTVHQIRATLVDYGIPDRVIADAIHNLKTLAGPTQRAESSMTNAIAPTTKPSLAVQAGHLTAGIAVSAIVSKAVRAAAVKAGVPELMLDHPAAKAMLALLTPMLLRAVVMRIPAVASSAHAESVLDTMQLMAVGSVATEVMDVVIEEIGPGIALLLGPGTSDPTATLKATLDT